MVKKTPGVAFYGKVRIPTIGHAEAINTAKNIAKKNGARLTIGLSHTSTPLNSSQKRVHAEKVFGHPVMTGDEHTKNLFSFLSHLNRSHDELHLVAGSDRAPEYRAHLERYNGKPDKSGNVLFNFKKWKVHEVEGKREDSGKDPTKMSREELVRSASASKLEKLAKEGNYEHFKAYHPGMPESHIKKVYGQIRKGLTLNEEITRKQLAPMLDSFVSFASDKLGLKSMPKVRYKTDEDGYNSFAAYSPMTNELSVSTINRHPMDIFRSVAHELVHHKQNEEGRIGKDIAKEGETGSDIENEANAEAGKIMRWFAKSNPNMFGKSFVVETNTAAMPPVGGVRGLGNVTGEVSPTVTSQYVLNNLAHTNNTQGLWIDDGLKSLWLDAKGKGEYQKKAVKSFKVLREQLTEGINDPGKLKAVFLAGGPGSGKDFVMNKALAGNGLREINSDTAFEFLMKKHGLDMEMPEEERVEREIVRGRAKNITSRKEINSLSGRLGLIVNGTADDLEKIKTVKAELEDLGYDTMMVFVNTSNEVSRKRNVDRGKGGGRKVPDGTDKQGVPNDSPDIRSEKWKLAQENISKFENLFGKDSFTVIDNTADIRKVAPDVKERIEAEFSRVRRMTMQFVQSPVKNKRGQDWVNRRARYQGVTNYVAPKSSTRTSTPTRTEMPKAIVKPSSILMDQARRLGLSYYGFGRFGRKVNGVNKVMYHSKGGQLVRIQTMNEEKKTAPKSVCWKGYEMIGMKNKNGRKVPNCVPISEEKKKIKMFMSKKGKVNRPLIHVDEKFEKMMEDELPLKMGYGIPIVDQGLGPETTQYRQMAALGFGAGLPLSESILAWVRNEKTHNKFYEKYGDLWEERLIDTAIMLEESGCGCEHSGKKSVKKLKESWPSAPYKSTYGDMSPIGVQRKDELDEGTPAWQRKEGKSESGGLNRKGIASYRRANPGSNLSMAVTTKPSKLKKDSKAAKRRKSFCARMGGMKKRLTSAKTAKDPNSRINKALRKWNCEE